MQMRGRRGDRCALAVLVAGGLVLTTASPAVAGVAPSLTSVAPASAPAGAAVTITGTGLAGATAVTFNGAAAAFTVTDDARLAATVPATATDGPVVVTSPDGTATTPFDVDEPPGPVTGLTARAGDRAVQLRWAPPAGDVAEVVVRRLEGSTPPESPAQGVVVTSGSPGQALDTGLTNGTAYSYSVWPRDAAGSLGPRASVSAVPAVPPAGVLRIGLSAARVTAGTLVSVTGALTRGGFAVAGEPVTLLIRPSGASSFAGTAAAVTDALGAVRFWFRVQRHTEFLLRDPGDAFSAETRSAAATVQARHGLVSRLTPAVVELGGTSMLEGRVGPAVAGVRVRQERWTGSSWAHVTTTVTDAAGGYRIPVRPTTGGEQMLRAVTVADSGHLSASGVALRLVTLARTLRSGSSGSDVLALEHRLADLRYDVGPISGVYDYDTRLAVMAFQKVHGLPRTGVADAVTRARLGTPSAPRPRYPVLGLSVEVDLARQILLFSRDGVVQRILPVSSGNNALYTVDGITSRAVTPTGRFRVTRKIDGVRVSRLGELYQPAYFVGGFAIHGSPSVPGHPASHGCIRITIPAMRRLFPLLPVGTPVAVYSR